MKKNINLSILIFILISLVILFTHQFFPLGIFSGLVQKTFSFPKQVLYGVRVGILNRLDFKGRAEVDALQDANKKLLEKLVDYETLKKENETFRSQFKEGNVKPAHLIPVHVVGFLGRYSLPHTLIIDKGEDGGVKEGNLVIIGKYLVGRIDKSSKSFSQVMLPINENFSTVAKTLSNSATGVVKGEGEFMLFDKILITDQIQKGDIVVTQGDINKNGKGLSPNIVIGRITSINRVENKPFQNAKIESVINFGRLENVFVLTPF